MRNSFVLLQGGSQEVTKPGIVQVWLLFSMEVGENKNEAEFATVKYMWCGPPRNKPEKVSGCVILQSCNEDDTDYT